MIDFLTYENYKKVADQNMGNHWKDYEKRWVYHSRVVDEVKNMGNIISSPNKVLELGTMGNSIVVGSDTMDNFTNRWTVNIPPTYMWDAKQIPWPIKDKQYKLFIALRVFQHLVPIQKECFQEAIRVSENIILVLPENYNNAPAITLDLLKDWGNGLLPHKFERITKGRRGILCVWKNIK